ncbi:ABC transporter ATP-binding protein [Tessaracoccus antarcticus]|uniref:Fatty acid ABC transporter ATP-binding/permease protein n=1 Tax=Tessaracoccus antarcticus TaxID=2479848 RepID=A0A3M0GG61_9ACTN|nr:ABC transporter ATP-binding protein [Tessaracoccus antarcticus]RMB61692.1 ABC transporter ATP-binding protein [Tessaracoccus antarcticus]
MSQKDQAPIKANKRPEDAPQRSGGPGHGPMVAPGEKAANFRTSLKRLLHELRPQRVRIIIAIMFGVAGVTLSVVGPKILGQATTMLLAGFLGKQFSPNMTREQVIEAVQSQGNGDLADLLRSMDFVPGQGVDFNAIGMILLTVLVLYLISGVASYVQAYVLNDAVQQSILTMRQKVSAKIDRLPLSYFDNQPRGELLSRVTNDIDNVSQTLQQTLSQLLNSLLMVVGVLAMMFWISPTLALVALVSVPVAMVMVSIIGKRSQVLFKANWKSTGDLNAHIEEAYTGHSLVKVFGRQKEVAAQFEKRNQELYTAAFGSQFISGLMMPIMMLVGNLNYVVIAVIGGLRVASGTMTIGDVQAFIQYSRQFTQPLTQVASMANLMQSGVASAERVFELMDADEMTPEPGGSLPEVRGHVTFSDVDFSYSPDKPLINDLDLEALPGQTVAIVGPTGAGKTTLVNLLMRFYDLDGGAITMDGVDIATVPRADVRRNIGMVLQDTWLFGGTIRDNIAYGRPGASEEDIIRAATATFVDRFVHSLPEGYDTVIDEEGSNISAGEKQLVTIARAFLADPALLILDEATSSVDTRTELLVQQAMSALRHGRTSFVIAHRLSTIRDADLILVMEQGAIVEQGTHDELLAAGGAYHDLYQSQFSAAVTT